MLKSSFPLLLSLLILSCSSKQSYTLCFEPRWKIVDKFEFVKRFEGCNYMESWIIGEVEYKCLANIPSANTGDPFVLYHYQTFGDSNSWDKKYNNSCVVAPEGLEKEILRRCVTSNTNPNLLNIGEYKLTNLRAETHQYMVYFPLDNESYSLRTWLDYKNDILENSYWCSWQDTKGQIWTRVITE